MILRFKQRFFSWFDSYDIYDENGNTVYVVKGQLSWGHCLKIFDAYRRRDDGKRTHLHVHAEIRNCILKTNMSVASAANLHYLSRNTT